LDAKEIAVALPPILLTWELIYDPPNCWHAAELGARSWRNARLALVAGILTVPYIWGKLLPESPLRQLYRYRPRISLHRLLVTYGAYCDDLFFRARWFTPSRTALVLLGLLLLAWPGVMSNVLDLLHSPLRTSVEKLRERFATARPFRHVVIEQFLAPSFCERLVAEFPCFDERNALNEMGEAGGKAVVSAVGRISSSYAAFDRLMRAQVFRDWLAEVTAISGLLYDAEYVGGGTHENLDGQELDWHVDFNYHPTRPLHRRLNLIVFLNPSWTEEWGGCLEFHRDPWHGGGIARSPAVLPLANTCVIFETTENSWHGFERIRLPKDGHFRSRRSIAVYFYTKTRAAVETAAPHGTIYVPRGLLPHLAPGYTLRAVDLEDLQVLLSRRDRQIQYLYGRELDLSRALTGIYRSPSFRLGRALTWPLRQLLAIWR
jgi:hypothetical protein